MTLRTSLVISGDSAGATAALASAEAGLSQVEQSARRAAAANDQFAAASNRATGQASAGYTQLGQQFQDIAVQLQSGTNIGTIVAQQGVQVASAVQMMGGRFSGLAAFLAGPWGAAITVGAGVLINMAGALWDNAEAAKAAEAGADSLAKAQGALAGLFDGANGRLKEQNDLLILNARLMAMNLRSEAMAKKASSESTFNAAGDRSWYDRIVGLYAPGQQSRRAAGEAGSIAMMVRNGLMTSDQALRQTENINFSGLKVTKQELQQAIIDAADANLRKKTADLIDKSLADGQLAPALRKDNRKKPGRKERGGAGARAEFAEDAGAKIATIRDQFADMPTAVEKANKAMRQLDDIASDIERRKLVNGPQLTAEIATVRKAIEDSLNKPFNDYLAKQRESAEFDKLLLQGREDEALALKDALAIQKQQGPLTQQQLDTILATVQGERQRSMVLRDQRALIQENLNAVHDLRSALEDSFAGLALGKGLNVGNVIKQIGDSYAKLAGKAITTALFGDALRVLEDKANGVSPVKVAGERMATELDKAGQAATGLADALVRAGGKIAPQAPASGAPGGAGGAAAQEADQGDIVVEARLPTSMIDKMVGALQQSGEQLRYSVSALLDPILAELDSIFGSRFFSQLSGALSGAMYGYATGGVPGGILGGLKEIKGLPDSLQKGLGKALGGAQTGTIVSGIANAVGIKLNKTGSQVGGAIGSFIPIPGGKIIGSVIGGLIGNLFGKTKTGAVSLGMVNGRAGVTGTGGNDAQLKSQLTGAAGSINGALMQIAQALGGDLGNYAVAIGKRKDEFRVSASGSVGNTTAKKTGSDIIYKGKDEAEAIQAALRNAIADGAVKGLSAAVQQALRSSSDIDAAIKEALKVQEVEVLIGGIGAQIEKQIKDFERQAAERVRIAQQYGFDLVKLEERNAKDRLKLTEKLLADQIGSLQTLIDEMTSGSLFEGSAVDRRGALLAQIGTAKAAADAGEDGAAEKLAKLLEDLNTVSREAFGTTGGFASDRTAILDAARDSIARANQRIADAQRASDPALATTNAALDENNSQNAQMLAAMAEMNQRLMALGASGGGLGISDLADYARLV